MQLSLSQALCLRKKTWLQNAIIVSKRANFFPLLNFFFLIIHQSSYTVAAHIPCQLTLRFLLAMGMGLATEKHLTPSLRFAHAGAEGGGIVSFKQGEIASFREHLQHWPNESFRIIRSNWRLGYTTGAFCWPKMVFGNQELLSCMGCLNAETASRKDKFVFWKVTFETPGQSHFHSWYEVDIQAAPHKLRHTNAFMQSLCLSPPPMNVSTQLLQRAKQIRKDFDSGAVKSLSRRSSLKECNKLAWSRGAQEGHFWGWARRRAAIDTKFCRNISLFWTFWTCKGRSLAGQESGPSSCPWHW